MSRKRRSNRLTVEQLEAKRELSEAHLNRSAVMIGFGQEDRPISESLYRTVALRVALKMVKDQEAIKLHVLSANGNVVMFRELKPVAHGVYCLPSMPNVKTAEALIGLGFGQARRVANLIMFPFETDRLARLTGPRVTEEDRKRANQLTGGMYDFSPKPATRVLRNEPLATAA